MVHSMKFLAGFLSLAVSTHGYQLRSLLNEASTHTRKRDECLSLVSHQSFYTVPLELGKNSHIVNAVVDTGSNNLVVDKSHESPSMQHEDPPKKIIVGYGSGDATMELVTDKVKVGARTVENQDIKLMEGSTFGFEIEGILPLGPDDQSGWKVDNGFSLCFHQNGAGSLMLGNGVSRGGFVQASGQWELPFTSLSVDDDSTGIAGTAVPDSGTTLIISPTTQDLAKLYVKICEGWENCKKSNGEKGDSVDDFYESVASDCGRTLPTISFSFGSTSASIPGSSYIVSSEAVCTPAFDVDSSFNFWILGLPLFSSNQVHFHGRHVSFTAGCASCAGGLNQRRPEGVWQLDGPPRWPTGSSRQKRKAHELVVGKEEVADPNVAQLIKHLSRRVWADRKQ